MRFLPPPGDEASPTVLPPNPTLYAVWPDRGSYEFELICAETGEPLPYDFSDLPAGASAHGAVVRVHTGECGHMTVRSNRGPSRARVYRLEHNASTLNPARPTIVRATREHKRFGCGPSDHLKLAINVDAAVVGVELGPDAERLLVPVYFAPSDPDSAPHFLLGHTMCRRSNVLPLERIDQPLQIRITALYPDGSQRRGPLQTIRPPAGQVGHDEATYDVTGGPETEDLLVVKVPLVIPAVTPHRAETILKAAARKPPSHRWLWGLLALPMALGLGLYLKRRY